MALILAKWFFETFDILLKCSSPKKGNEKLEKLSVIWVNMYFNVTPLIQPSAVWKELFAGIYKSLHDCHNQSTIHKKCESREIYIYIYFKDCKKWKQLTICSAIEIISNTRSLCSVQKHRKQLIVNTTHKIHWRVQSELLYWKIFRSPVVL